MSSGFYAVNERKKNILLVQDAIHEAERRGIVVSYERLRARCSIDLGMSERRITEYLKVLEMGDVITITENEEGEKVIKLIEHEQNATASVNG